MKVALESGRNMAKEHFYRINCMRFLMLLFRHDKKMYTGEWKSDKRHGKGQLTLPDGKRMEGVWKDDGLEGIGFLILPNGRKKKAQFRKNKLVTYLG